MARTQLNGAQIANGTIGRADIDAVTAGNALILRLLSADANLLISSSTGPDSGTGDVSIALGFIPQGALIKNSSADASVTGFAADTYLSGSACQIPTAPVIGAVYQLEFSVSKTAVGVAAPAITIRYGATGTIADAARGIMTFGAGTAVGDTGMFKVTAVFVVVGTSGAIRSMCGLTSDVAAGGISTSIKSKSSKSAAFDTAPTAGWFIGASYNAGASAAHTVFLVSACLVP